MLDTDLNLLWEEVKTKIQNQIARPTYDTFFKPTSIIACNDDTYIVYIENEISKNAVESHLNVLEDILSHLVGQKATIKLVTDKAKFNPHLLEQKKQPSSLTYDEKTLREKFNLNSNYTFDKFIIGKSNQLAHAASLSIAESMSKDLACPKKFNPLFIYGGSGLGKTHLMHAVANHILKSRPEANVIYVTTEDFINEFIDCIRSTNTRDKIDSFKEKYRHVDILLIDDIQFLSDKEGTQEEFFHTFNTLYQSNKQIILTSDRPPHEIKKLEDRLLTRFKNGLTADIKPPDTETRIAILKNIAQFEGYDIPDEVLSFMADNINSSIRELEGSLLTLMTYANLNAVGVTIALAKDVLQSDIQFSPVKQITIEGIQNLVCQTYGVRFNDLIGKKRPQNIAFPRQIAMFLCRELTDFSLPKIGESFGGRDHSTILHGIEKIKDAIGKDPALKANISQMKSELRGEKK